MPAPRRSELQAVGSFDFQDERLMAKGRNGRRYATVSTRKATGATYTPRELADFVALRLVESCPFSTTQSKKRRGPFVRILDPAVGDGQLLESLIEAIPGHVRLQAVGFDRDAEAVRLARRRLSHLALRCDVVIRKRDFLEQRFSSVNDQFDLIIANPPYVRAQVLGAEYSKWLAKRFGLSGRIDLYYAFLLAMAGALRPNGFMAVITSNRFMTTRAGKVVRRMFRRDLRVRHVWDFGDTRIFDAAVLPAVVLAGGRDAPAGRVVKFSSLYDYVPSAVVRQSLTDSELTQGHTKPPVIEAVTQSFDHTGLVRLTDGRTLQVVHGRLASKSDDDVWRVVTKSSERWLKQVEKKTWKSFGEIGSIRVGVKTCADKVFIRDDWDAFNSTERPELLRPLTTHHVARPFRATKGVTRKQIVYPHRSRRGKPFVVDLKMYPRTKAYLESHARILKSRKYVLDAGRKWYELWVPQNPSFWRRPKLVFRDIAAKPCFWIDKSGSVVNGDCYWMVAELGSEELLWLAAAVGNSSFIEKFYDLRFPNRLYAGRRRFVTQYVQNFPLPDPQSVRTHRIVNLGENRVRKAE